MFEPTHYDERVAHALGLNYQELQDKFKQEELEHKRAGCDRGQATTTIGVMKTQMLCFRPIDKIELQHTVESFHSSTCPEFHYPQYQHLLQIDLILYRQGWYTSMA